MTTPDVVGAAIRRWYVMVVGAAVSVGLVYLATHQQGVYWTQFNVVLIGPKANPDANYLKNTPYSLHPVVGVVVSDLNNGSPTMPTASVSTIMVGQGIREGVQVRTANQGTQWNPSFSANYMDVQVADDSPEAVAEGARLTVARIEDSLRVRQEELEVPRSLRITALASSTDPPVYFIQGNRMRAAGATGLAGAAITTILVVWLDRLLLRRRRRLG